MTTSQTQLAYERLRRQIFTLRLLPGEPLVERHLERLLTLSRTPIRSALARLEREGLVRTTQRYGGRGFVVAPLDRREIEEAYDFRLVLECESVRLAAARGRGRNGRLESLLRNAEQIEDADAWLANATDFHVSLARLAGNRFLSDTLAALLPRIERARILQVMEERERNQQEHREVWTRVCEGDGDGACRVITAHIRHSKRQLLDALADQQRRLLAYGARVRA